LKKFKIIFFKKYWNNNILNQFALTQDNLSYLQLESWDQYNHIKSKLNQIINFNFQSTQFLMIRFQNLKLKKKLT